MPKRTGQSFFDFETKPSRVGDRWALRLMWSVLSAGCWGPVFKFGPLVYSWSKAVFCVFAIISFAGSAAIFFTYAVPEVGKKLGFPWIWTMLRYLFPKSVRERNYDLVIDELREDYENAKSYITKPVMAWLCFCFTLRTLLVVLDTFRALVVDKCVWLLPDSVRTWWRRG